jgi:hypothetical protein
MTREVVWLACTLLACSYQSWQVLLIRYLCNGRGGIIKAKVCCSILAIVDSKRSLSLSLMRPILQLRGGEVPRELSVSYASCFDCVSSLVF